MIRAVTSLYSEFRMFPYPLSRHVTLLMDFGEFLSTVPRFLGFATDFSAAIESLY